MVTKKKVLANLKPAKLRAGKAARNKKMSSAFSLKVQGGGR